VTRTESPTWSGSATPSDSSTASGTVTRSNLGTTTQSTSQSPTSTVTPEPYGLAFSPSTPAFISDSLPPVSLGAVLSRCPTDPVGSISVTLSCAANEPALLSPLTAVSTRLLCSPESAATVPLPVSLSLVAAFDSMPSPSTTELMCTVSNTATGEVQTARRVNLAVAPTAWPLWEDVILVTPSGIMRSARFGLVRNGSAVLHAAAAAALDSESTASNASIMLSAVQIVWGAKELPNTTAGGGRLDFQRDADRPVIHRTTRKAMVRGRTFPRWHSRAPGSGNLLRRCDVLRRLVDDAHDSSAIDVCPGTASPSAVMRY